MNDLSPSGRALLDAARGARPASSDRARIRAKLDARLALGAAVAAAAVPSVAAASSLSSAAGATVAPAALSTTTTVASTAVVGAKAGLFGLLAKIGLAVVVLGATGAGIHAWVSPSPSSRGALAARLDPALGEAAEVARVESAPMDRGVSDAPAPSAQAAQPPEEAATPEPSQARPPVGSAQRPPPGGRDAVSIAAEVALLRSAQNALKDGDGEASLRAIDSLAAKHPNGAMREERQAARVLALCSLGRVEEARSAASSFLAEFPNSVHAAQVRGSCAAGR